VHSVIKIPGKERCRLTIDQEEVQCKTSFSKFNDKRQSNKDAKVFNLLSDGDKIFYVNGSGTVVTWEYSRLGT
jgi:hypothetical protein